MCSIHNSNNYRSITGIICSSISCSPYEASKGFGPQLPLPTTDVMLRGAACEAASAGMGFWTPHAAPCEILASSFVS